MCIIVTVVRESLYIDKLQICILFQKMEKKHVIYKVKTYFSVLFVKLRNAWVLLAADTPHISHKRLKLVWFSSHAIQKNGLGDKGSLFPI